MPKEIPLTQGRVAIVDDEDYDYLMQWKWYAARSRRDTYYAKRNQTLEDGKQRQVLMHRVILGVGTGISVDHINHDGLDNRRVNLRPATEHQNTSNRRPHIGASSAYKGVCKKRGRWIAVIHENGKQTHIGSFPTEEDAARAYDEKAKLVFGDFAFLNLPS